MEQGDAISRSALLNDGIRVEYGYNDDGLLLIPMRDVHDSIRKAPSLDVAPVVHAHWTKDFIKIGNCDWKYKCSKCGKYNKQYSPPFCPHCGAKMDGWKDDENAHEV